MAFEEDGEIDPVSAARVEEWTMLFQTAFKDATLGVLDGIEGFKEFTETDLNLLSQGLISGLSIYYLIQIEHQRRPEIDLNTAAQLIIAGTFLVHGEDVQKACAADRAKGMI